MMTRLVPKLGMMFYKVEDCLEFYKRHVVYVWFSIRTGATMKDTNDYL